MADTSFSPFKRIAAKIFLLELVGLVLAFGALAGSVWFFTGQPLRLYTLDESALYRALFTALLLCIAALIVIALYVARIWTNRIRALDTTTQRLAAGDLSTAIPAPNAKELAALAANMDLMRQHWRAVLENFALKEKRYATVVESLDAAAVITDAQQTILALNSAAETLLRQKREQVLGLAWYKLFAFAQSQDHSLASFWQTIGAGMNGHTHATLRGRFPLQSFPQVVLDVVSTPVVLDGTAQGYVHMLKDASELEQVTREKDEFLLSVAHELRGPLAAQRASIELLLQDYASLNKRDLGGVIRILHRSVVNFQGLVENLVDIGRLRAGRFTVISTATPLHRLVQDAVLQIEPLLQAKGQQLEMQIKTPPDCNVMVDRPRVIQVLLNLLRNANKYGLEDQPITLTTFCEGAYAFIEVTDRGPGIAPEEQAGLFQRFYRVKRVEEEGAGIGLGLALAKGIVEAHGGQIGLRSQIGEGATFWFSVPLAQ
jgi:PAS domain S-box-containing protein